jgi:nicotinamide-nucleotide amidase
MVPGMAFGVKRIGVASPDFERIGVASPDFVVMLPGVPEEFQSIVRDGVVPLLKERFKLKPPESATLRTFGVPESWLAERLARPMRGRPRVRPAFYPSTTGVDVVLRAPAGTDLTFLRERVFRTLGEAVYEVGERSMAEVVGALLRERKQTVASAESCTGGLTGDWLTNVAGSSDWFLGGVVAYSNELKTLLCGVRAATLDRHGAVSPETAAEMARGARLLAGASYGLAVSGIAGPSGGSDKKPVGLAYVAVASARGTRVEKHVFDGDRRMVKEQSAMAALDLLRRELRAKAEGRRRRSEGTTRRRAEG